MKKMLTGLAMGGLLGSVAVATSVREYQQMTMTQKDAFLDKELLEILSRIKAYDPQLAAKTRHYMLDETNSFGGALGLGAVLDVVSVTEQKHPESMDKIQIETATEIIIQNYWKREGYAVPASVLGLKEKASPPAVVAAGTNSAAH
jgi:hypothetical protein